MKIGAMNHPGRPVVREIRDLVEGGAEFIDLTLEPPQASVWNIKLAEVRQVLRDHRLDVVGHTAYYLPLASPFDSLRQCAIDEIKRCIDAFAELGAHWVNVHPDRHTPLYPRQFFVDQNKRSLETLIAHAHRAGLGMMLENIPGDFNDAGQLGELFDPLPDLGLHLDIGHANLQVAKNTTAEILESYGARLRHVHLHDNKGGSADLHLALGCGTINIRSELRDLRRSGYDGTITLEVFAPDRHYFSYSKQVLRTLWDELASERP